MVKLWVGSKRKIETLVADVNIEWLSVWERTSATGSVLRFHRVVTAEVVNG